MMKQLALFTLALALLTPLAAGAQNLATNAPQRQAILDLEYLLNQPGVPAARAAQLAAEITQLETQANGSVLPPLATSNLDYQQTVIDNRAIYDLQVNLKQRGC